jgi:hypothetical protein
MEEQMRIQFIEMPTGYTAVKVPTGNLEEISKEYDLINPDIDIANGFMVAMEQKEALDEIGEKVVVLIDRINQASQELMDKADNDKSAVNESWENLLVKQGELDAASVNYEHSSMNQEDLIDGFVFAASSPDGTVSCAKCANIAGMIDLLNDDRASALSSCLQIAPEAIPPGSDDLREQLAELRSNFKSIVPITPVQGRNRAILFLRKDIGSV